MTKLVCHQCAAKLKLPDGFAGTSLKCPRCGHRIACPGPAGPVGSARILAPARETEPIRKHHSDSPASTRASRAGLLRGLLDVRFERYLTPSIIRWSWILVLGTSALWIVFLALVFATSWIPTDGGAASIGANSVPPIDLEALLNGQPGQLPGLGELLGGNLSAADRKPTIWQTATGRGWRFLLFVTSLTGLLLTLLWCRVMLETIIVIFDIRDCLHRIDSRSGPGPDGQEPVSRD